MVSVPGLVTIIGMMANDHPRDGGHPWDRLENFDHPKNDDHHRDGDHPRDDGCLRDFYYPKGWLLIFGSVES